MIHLFSAESIGVFVSREKCKHCFISVEYLIYNCPNNFVERDTSLVVPWDTMAQIDELKFKVFSYITLSRIFMKLKSLR